MASKVDTDVVIQLAETGREINPVKKLPKTAMQAYLTLKALGCSQKKVAEIMTEKLKPKKPYKQFLCKKLRWHDKKIRMEHILE